MTSVNPMLEKDTGRALVSMSVPISLGMLSTFLFQVIDTYFVGQLGAEALAALSFASTVYFLMVGLFIGLSVGVSILVGSAQGQGNLNEIQSTATLGLMIGVSVTTVLAWALVAWMDPLFSLLGASHEILPLIRAYMVPLVMGMPLLTFGLVGGGALRATGVVTPPEVIMGVAGAINLVFDYLLIFGAYGFPEMGIQGAALATVLSWVFVMVAMTVFLVKGRIIRVTSGLIAGLGARVKELLRLSLPTVITQMIGPFTLMYLTLLLARESQLAVAAFGVASRIETLLLIGILGVSTAITPFIAQNAGAGKQLRIDEAIAFGGKASTYLGLAMAVLLSLTIRPIAGWFTVDTTVVANTVFYFYVVSLSYMLYGLYLITTSVYNGLQLPMNSLKITLVKTFALTMPLTWVGSFWGVEGIFLGLAVSNVGSGFYASQQMRKTFRAMDSPLAEVNVWAQYLQDFRRAFRIDRGA